MGHLEILKKKKNGLKSLVNYETFGYFFYTSLRQI